MLLIPSVNTSTYIVQFCYIVLDDRFGVLNGTLKFAVAEAVGSRNDPELVEECSTTSRIINTNLINSDYVMLQHAFLIIKPISPFVSIIACWIPTTEYTECWPCPLFDISCWLAWWQVEDPSKLLMQNSRECTPSYLSTGISNLLQPAQADVVLGQLSRYLAKKLNT
jgi:hypothetical protein